MLIPQFQTEMTTQQHHTWDMKGPFSFCLGTAHTLKPSARVLNSVELCYFERHETDIRLPLQNDASISSVDNNRHTVLHAAACKELKTFFGPPSNTATIWRFSGAASRNHQTIAQMHLRCESGISTPSGEW